MDGSDILYHSFVRWLVAMTFFVVSIFVFLMFCCPYCTKSQIISISVATMSDNKNSDNNNINWAYLCLFTCLLIYPFIYLFIYFPKSWMTNETLWARNHSIHWIFESWQVRTSIWCYFEYLNVLFDTSITVHKLRTQKWTLFHIMLASVVVRAKFWKPILYLFNHSTLVPQICHTQNAPCTLNLYQDNQFNLISHNANGKVEHTNHGTAKVFKNAFKR